MAERYSPVLELTMARIREIVREPGFVFWIFGFPVVMAVGLGIAFRHRPPDEPAVVVVQDSAWVEDALVGADGLATKVLPKDDALQSLRTSAADIMVWNEGTDDERSVGYRYDPMRPQGRLARHEVSKALQAVAGRVDVASEQDEEVTEKGARYIDFLLPGLVGLNLMGSSMWGIGYTIVLSRKRRQLRRFAATPMRRSHFLLGYIFSRLAFLALELVGLAGLGFLAFGVEVQGSYLAMAVVALLGAASFAGLSFLVAARVQSVEAANGWMNFIMMPMWILSGVFFSYERFPEVVHPFLQLLPLTALNDALRGIVNEGTSIVALGPEVAVLAVWGVLPFWLALRWFRWQ